MPLASGLSKEYFGVEPRTLGLRDVTGNFLNLIGHNEDLEKDIKATQDIPEYPLPSLKNKTSILLFPQKKPLKFAFLDIY